MAVISGAHAALGAAARERREAIGLTQAEVAERSGLHRNYIGGIERGERNLTLTNIMRLAGALRMRPSELVRSVEPHDPPRRARI